MSRTRNNSAERRCERLNTWRTGICCCPWAPVSKRRWIDAERRLAATPLSSIASLPPAATEPVHQNCARGRQRNFAGGRVAEHGGLTDPAVAVFPTTTVLLVLVSLPHGLGGEFPELRWRCRSPVKIHNNYQPPPSQAGGRRVVAAGRRQRPPVPCSATAGPSVETTGGLKCGGGGGPSRLAWARARLPLVLTAAVVVVIVVLCDLSSGETTR